MAHVRKITIFLMVLLVTANVIPSNASADHNGHKEKKQHQSQQKNHHEISQKVLKRESVGSLSNYLACHTTAEKGIYSDDNVKIPK